MYLTENKDWKMTIVQTSICKRRHRLTFCSPVTRFHINKSIESSMGES